MAIALPFIAMAASGVGALSSGMARSQALTENAGIYAAESKTAGAQGLEAENEQRRKAGTVLGHMVAAAGQSGTGYGGSNGRFIDQSAVNAEHDALSIRYKSQLQKWAYLTQSQNLKQEASDAGRAGVLNTGAALLKGFSSSYVGDDLS